jgi:hypothetical protein
MTAENSHESDAFVDLTAAMDPVSTYKIFADVFLQMSILIDQIK